MNKFPPIPRASHLDRFECFRKFAILASQGAPPVSMTPVTNLPPVSTTLAANFAISFAIVVDRWQFATDTTPAANLPPMLMTPVANNGNNIRLLRPYSELEGKMYL